MFLFYVVIPIKSETVLCLKESDYVKGKNPKIKGNCFRYDHFCKTVFEYSIWIQAENIKQTGEIGKLYEELIEFIRNNPKDEEEVKKKIDEYVAAILEHLKLGKSGPCASRDKVMNNILFYLREIESRNISLPSEPCKKKEFCDLEPDDIYFYYFEFHLNRLILLTASDHVEKSPDDPKDDYFRNRDFSGETRPDNLLKTAYINSRHTGKFTNQYFYFEDLLLGEDISKDFQIDYKRDAPSHHITYFLKGNTSEYMNLFSYYFSIR